MEEIDENDENGEAAQSFGSWFGPTTCCVQRTALSSTSEASLTGALVRLDDYYISMYVSILFCFVTTSFSLPYLGIVISILPPAVLSIDGADCAWHSPAL